MPTTFTGGKRGEGYVCIHNHGHQVDQVYVQVKVNVTCDAMPFPVGERQSEKET